jgi:hypothetical protein
VTNGSVNPNLAGPYTIQYVATDLIGNSTTNTRTVNVVDTTAPTIVYHFTNLVVNANSNCQASLPDLTSTNYVIASDVCSSVTVTQMPSAGTTLSLGTNVVVLAAFDSSGNVAWSTNTVLVADLTPPIVTLLGSTPMTVECHTPFTDPGATALDNCAGVVSVATNGMVLSDTPGTYTVVYVATDASGNSGTNMRTVNVVDTTPPIIVYSFTNLTLSANADCLAPLPDVTGSNYIIALDACSSVTVTQVPPMGTLLPKGTNAVVLTAFDSAGNSVSGTNFIIVADLTPPMLFAPANVVVSSDPGQCSATNIALGTPTANDNCSSVVTTNNAPELFPVGTNVVIWTAIDTQGNTTNATQLVIVNDTELPSIACLAAVTVSTDAGQAYASGVNLGTPVTSDNCGVAAVTNDAPANFPIGTNAVTWTVIDLHGNVRTCVEQIIVNSPPEAAQRISGIVNNGDGTFTVSFSGAPTSNYIVQVSANLADWQPVHTNTAGEDGTWSYTDQNAPNVPARYYRSMRP